MVALGANIGDPRHQLHRALIALSEHLGPLQVAPLFRSAAVSTIPQPEFLNSVVWLPAARLPPLELLALARSLERAAGRRAGPPNGPRPLDVDLLLIDDAVLEHPGLSIPHPRMRSRAFVLAPLAALLPDRRLPPDGATPSELLAALPPDPSLERLPWVPRRELP